ncbi:MAG: hypothetical protein G8D61_16685 [gamma proteobacterium symbiont of Ctena orbiculata]|nr:hypothetical protein [Candidatus Thiodiazotropha taylori]MBT3060073.1 hypothetical protein [Candidatus Thiodiazotropha sp. (ex Lucina pensylvanica)]MBV2096951.1 hypothetical protein [Candidatus Thiodiazotropha sp. (ex Codakia orbicularis)]PUB74352.1 MAG: hypothetical protein DBO99_18520 [gamma proteobacterium symbiont of Ctena orbiculata]MBT3064481.1 hypothetical protein [Candidatus Thiodiazotropha sp. (ex Lucina pensylvanica)]
MDSSSIDLPGSEVESIEFENGRLTIRFSRAIVIKTMSGSEERTRWWQAGALVYEAADLESAIPGFPCVCEGGDVGENVYTYRDMIPIPLQSQGRARCDLKFDSSEERLQAWAEGVELVMEDRPHYIEHLRKSN